MATYYLIKQADEIQGGAVIHTQHAPIGKATRLERGPIWLGEPSETLQINTLKALTAMTKPSWFERRRFYPDIDADSSVASALPGFGLKRVDIGYRTIWLDLRMPFSERRAQLRQNWRSALNKAEKSSITIEASQGSETLSWLAAHHELAMRRQHFTGPTTPFLMALKNHAAEGNGLLLLRALYLNKPVAGALFVRHGRAATRQDR
ncbi:MAG: GNAT family N-acetyltransferase, partial [Pseudomonadota bacterium]